MRQIDRVFKITRCVSQHELAALLQIRQSSVSSIYTSQEGKVPAKWLLSLLLLKGINPAWIITGTGSMYLGSINECIEKALPTVLQDTSKLLAYITTEELCVEITRRVLLTEQAFLDKTEDKDTAETRRITDEIRARLATRSQAQNPESQCQ